jgi:hypothetical protein
VIARLPTGHLNSRLLIDLIGYRAKIRGTGSIASRKMSIDKIANGRCSLLKNVMFGSEYT